MEQAVNFSLGVLAVFLLMLVPCKKGLSIDCTWMYSVQVVVICQRRMQFGSEEISGVLGVAVRCSHISY